MSRETWLRPNRRVLALSLALPAIVLVLGAALLVAPRGAVATVVGGLLVLAGLAGLAAIAHASRQPRLAYERGEMCLYLRAGQPIRVPIRDVECFFLGQAPSLLPGNSTAKTSAIVVRLAESATQWKHVPVSPRLGQWRDGYVTIRGTWTEPIHAELLRQLNDRLRKAHADSH
jgi:hypothetical protein